MDLLQTLNPEYETREDDTVRSIHDHLNKLLNARKHLLPHIPEYGLSDFSSFEGKTGIIELIREEIKAAILSFEPRVVRLKVVPDREVPEKFKDFLAVYTIKAVLTSDPDDPGITFKYKIRLDGRVEEMD